MRRWHTTAVAPLPHSTPRCSRDVILGQGGPAGGVVRVKGANGSDTDRYNFFLLRSGFDTDGAYNVG